MTRATAPRPTTPAWPSWRVGRGSRCGWRPSRRAAGPIAYPGDWQVGDRVSIDLPDLELRFDRRVEAVRVRADAGEAIAVDCAFGAPAPDAADTLRRIAERTTPARFA